MGTRALFQGVNPLRREADQSPLTIAEVKKPWLYTATPPYIFMAQCLVKHRDKFNLALPVP
jgi:hypothetical protein